ncbi:hypothetical protein [Streptomyces sp. NPDC058694]|uniref:hypothetical protein n=1 Tax=Streptomyces sp. NPDC058694 TaxID=3346603 RepID=UPI00365137A4
MNDDELLALLRAGDPALTSRAPLPDANRLVEAALQTDAVILSENTATDTTTRTAKAAAGRGRRRLFGLAATVALLIGGGITVGITANSGDGHSDTANTPLSLTLAGDGNSKCAAPVPDQLAGYPTLFYGTATSVKGPLVTFHVDHWLRGGGTDTVLVNSDPDLPERLTFTVGEHYIVAADENDTIPVCGANWASQETWKEFRQAFGK